MGADSNSDIRYAEYPLFKGLQKPLEFMGVQGRYIYWAAGAIGGAIIGFIVAYCLIGFLAGLITLVLALGTGAAFIFIKQKKGCIARKAAKGYLSTLIQKKYDKIMRINSWCSFKQVYCTSICKQVANPLMEKWTCQI